MMFIRWIFLTLAAAFLIGCGGGVDEPPAAQVETGTPAGTGPGTLNGFVLYNGPPAPPQKIRIVKDLEVCGRANLFSERLKLSGDGIVDVVVSVARRGGAEKHSGGAARAAFAPDTFTIDQRDCRYDPHMLLVHVGSTVRFLNSDGILHNIHSFCKANRPKNIAQPAMVKQMHMTFEIPERVQLRCDIHGWMSAWVIVTDNPRSTLTTAGGRFSFDGLDPGDYTVTCWQEQFGEKTADVRIEPGKAAEVRFNFGG